MNEARWLRSTALQSVATPKKVRIEPLAEKLVIMVTHGPEHPEHVTIPFVMAVAALASDVEAVIGLQAEGVEIAVKGRSDSVTAEGFPPLSKLMSDYMELGGKLLLCGPCLKSRQIDAATQLVENAEVVAAARFVAEITSATNALVY
jgi:predicted peroxiredoxin